jgi:hypothetical protein
LRQRLSLIGGSRDPPPESNGQVEVITDGAVCDINWIDVERRHKACLPLAVTPINKAMQPHCFIKAHG